MLALVNYPPQVLIQHCAQITPPSNIYTSTCSCNNTCLCAINEYVYQRLQSTIQYHNVCHWVVISLGYSGEAPIQKVFETLLFHIRACHEPVQSCIMRQESKIRVSMLIHNIQIPRKTFEEQPRPLLATKLTTVDTCILHFLACILHCCFYKWFTVFDLWVSDQHKKVHMWLLDLKLDVCNSLWY